MNNPTLREVYIKTIASLSADNQVENDVRVLLCANNNLNSMSELFVNFDKKIFDLQRFHSDLARLIDSEPVEYIVGKSNFLGREFIVSHDVLIPRNETEELVKYVENKLVSLNKKEFLVADIGTGSGCIAISLSLDLNISCIATDISLDALKIAKLNNKHLKSNVSFLHGDILYPLIDNDIKLDAIVSNPPYIKENFPIAGSVFDFEPHVALFAKHGTDFYEDIFRNCKHVLNSPGYMLFEISPDIINDLEELLKKYLPEAHYEIVKDINQNERILFVSVEKV
ncbi:MAG: peptide chain release factor N(5)-glutamine methyltransferase [Bacilli bacterium]|jgi:release factor glutamine methyltransferase